MKFTLGNVSPARFEAFKKTFGLEERSGEDLVGERYGVRVGFSYNAESKSLVTTIIQNQHNFSHSQIHRFLLGELEKAK